jgi:hypothetical protein
MRAGGRRVSRGLLQLKRCAAYLSTPLTQIAEGAALDLQQRMRRVKLEHAAGVEHQDLVGVDDCPEPVGDDEHRRRRQLRGHGLLDGSVGRGVEVGRALVEQEDVAPLLELEQAARERQQLPLAGREVLA